MYTKAMTTPNNDKNTKTETCRMRACLCVQDAKLHCATPNPTPGSNPWTQWRVEQRATHAVARYTACTWVGSHPMTVLSLAAHHTGCVRQQVTATTTYMCSSSKGRRRKSLGKNQTPRPTSQPTTNLTTTNQPHTQQPTAERRPGTTATTTTHNMYDTLCCEGGQNRQHLKHRPWSAARVFSLSA